MKNKAPHRLDSADVGDLTEIRRFFMDGEKDACVRMYERTRTTEGKRMQKIFSYGRKLVLRFVWKDLAAARALLALITTNHAAMPSGVRPEGASLSFFRVCVCRGALL